MTVHEAKAILSEEILEKRKIFGAISLSSNEPQAYITIWLVDVNLAHKVRELVEMYIPEEIIVVIKTQRRAVGKPDAA